MIQKLLPKKRLVLWLVSCLAVLLIVPALIVIHPGISARASGGGGGGGSPSASIYPTQGSPGITVNINGFNYQPNVRVSIYFQTKSNGVVTAVTDTGGFFYATLAVPDTYTPGTHYYVHINSTAFSESVLFTFTKPSLQIFGQYNGNLTYGAQAQINGNGFAANETVDLTWNLGTLGVQKAGVAVGNPNGDFFSNIIMPSIPFGTQAHLIATGRISGLTASLLVHESPAIYATPYQGVIGTTVKLQGGGFGSGEHVKVLFQNQLVGTPVASLKGSFSTSFVVPATATLGYQNNGIIATGKTSGVGAQTFFDVLPNVTISPNSGFSGTFINVRGSHFTPNGYVEILWIFPNGGGSGGSGGNTLFIGSAPVNSHGTFNTTVQAPQELVSKVKYYVLVIDGPSNGSNQVPFHAL